MTFFLKKPKLNECGILNLDLNLNFSGEEIHWIMWLQKCMDKFYFDSFEVQPPSEQIAYLKSPIFYNTERVQQNGEVFCVIYVSSY